MMNWMRFALSLCAAVLAAEEITLNFVAKDKKGAAVKTLDSTQVEVSDGGAKRAAAVVRLVEGGSTPEQRRRLFVIAFEQMDEQVDRRQAKAGVLNFLNDDKNPDHWFAVAMLSNQLSLLQPFTADRASLTKAVEVATSGAANTRFAEMNTASKQALAGDSSTLGQTQRKMLAFDGKLSDTDKARRTVLCLDSLASGLGAYPGRKAILFVANGLLVPTFIEPSFIGLMARANRAGVSFYGLDARGATAESQTGAVANQIGRVAANAASAGETLPAERGDLTNTEFLQGDGVQEVLRGSPQAKMRILSEDTGGFVIADSNDPKVALRQMLEDSDSYYEVTYDPGITDFDGSFRKTSVKTKAKDTKLRDRDGYFALKAEQLDLQPFELPLLSAIGTSPLPKEFDFRAGAVRLRQGKDEVTGSLLVEVPLAGMTFKENKAAGLFAGRLTMLTQVKDAQGKIVSKFSREVPMQGKSAQLAALQASNFSFREQFAVTPGRYVVETAVSDVAGGKRSAKRVSFVATAKPAGAGVSMSGITLVRNFQPNQTGLAPEDPFQFKGGRITPTLNQTMKAAKGAQMALFFLVYPDGGAAPEAVIRYLRDGAELTRAAMPLGAADASGKIAHVFSSPIDTMPPGLYEINVQVKQGTSATEGSVLVTIE